MALLRVMAGLAPAIPIWVAQRPPHRDRRDKPGDDTRLRGTPMPGRLIFLLGLCAAVALTMLAAPGPARAQDAVAQFYKGKQISLYLGSSAGGRYPSQPRPPPTP